MIQKSLIPMALVALLVSAVIGSRGDGTITKSPLIVANRVFAQQTGSISQILFTPRQTASYRVSVYQNQAPNNYGPIIQLVWTDELGQEQTPSDVSFCSTISSNSNAYVCDGQLYVRAIAGNPIQLNTYVNPAAPPYNIYVTVEEL